MGPWQWRLRPTTRARRSQRRRDTGTTSASAGAIAASDAGGEAVKVIKKAAAPVASTAADAARSDGGISWEGWTRRAPAARGIGWVAGSWCRGWGSRAGGAPAAHATCVRREALLTATAVPSGGRQRPAAGLNGAPEAPRPGGPTLLAEAERSAACGRSRAVLLFHLSQILGRYDYLQHSFVCVSPSRIASPLPRVPRAGRQVAVGGGPRRLCPVVFDVPHRGVGARLTQSSPPAPPLPRRGASRRPPCADPPRARSVAQPS